MLGKQATNVTLMYIFRGTVHTETIPWFEATMRAKQLSGCTLATIYSTHVFGETDLREYNGNTWNKTKDAPEEIKLAALLLN